MNLTLLSPHWLWLLPGVTYVVLVRSRVLVPWHALLRMLVLTLLLLALAQPAAWISDQAEHAVFVFDGSPSVAAVERQAGAETLAAAVRGLPAAVRPFLVTIADPPPVLAAAFADRQQVAAGGSSLSAALTAALQRIPDGARGSVTLLSDGRATDRRWGEALLALQQRRIPLHTLPLPAAAVAPQLAGLRALQPPRAGHTVLLEVEVVGSGGSARVGIADADGSIGEAEVGLAAGHGVARIAWEPQQPGFPVLQATLGEQRLARTFAVQEPLAVLYLGHRVASGHQQLQRLVGPGLRLHAWDAGSAEPMPALQGYDLAVLDDVPAEVLGKDRQRALVEQVTQRGLGLFACGGEAAFGPGGYHDSELAHILPVEAVQKEEKRDPSTTLVLIIDTSGSMSGERVQLAKEVARLAMSRLLPHDKVGIVEFYGAKRWAAPIQPASNMIDLARAINRMDAGGGTVIMPAIEEAYYGLQNVDTRYKHVLILTDAGVETGAFEPLLRRMAEDGVNVSTVLVGPEAHSEFLVDVANWGKGRFYAVPDRFNLPELLFKQPTNSRLPAYKPGRFPVTARRPGWWGDVDRTAVPPIAGYTETMARPGAEVLLEVGGERDPVLATWRHGLGRVTAMTTEPVGPGTEPWRDWPGFGPWLARVLTRTADDGRACFRFTLARRGSELELLAERQRPGDELPEARQLAVDGRDLGAVAFAQRAPAMFVARWTAPPAREQRLLASVQGDGREPVQRLCSNASDDERGELAVPPAAGLDLAAAARSTGGDALAALAGRPPRAGGGEAPLQLYDLVPLLLLLALALYLFDIFHRRRDARGRA